MDFGRCVISVLLLGFAAGCSQQPNPPVVARVEQAKPKKHIPGVLAQDLANIKALADLAAKSKELADLNNTTMSPLVPLRHTIALDPKYSINHLFCFSPDSKLLISGSVWDMTTWREIAVLHTNDVFRKAEDIVQLFGGKR
jgi:hypothetical protein